MIWRNAVGVIALLALAGCGGKENGGINPVATPNLIRACIRTAACGYRPYPSISACVTNADLSSPVEADRFSCLDRATTCAEAGACLGEKGECDKTYQASCQNGSAVYCDLIDHLIYTRRCGDFGLTCKTDTAYAFNATCTGSGQTPATIETTLNCAGDLCTKTGQTCSGTLNDRCANDQLESCLDGQWVRFECARLGLDTCHTSGETAATTWGHCRPPSTN